LILALGGSQRIWHAIDEFAVAKRSGDTAFRARTETPNVSGNPKAPSPLRSAGALQKCLISLGIFQEIMRLPASPCRAGAAAKADAHRSNSIIPYLNFSQKINLGCIVAGTYRPL
jgi:hypothetical protein